MDIEDLREKLHSAIEGGNCEKVLQINQELDLLIFKFIINEQKIKTNKVKGFGSGDSN